MPINMKWATGPSGTKNLNPVGFGGGQYLVYRNLLSPADGQPVSARTLERPATSTTDFYLTDGLCDFRAWDLLKLGSPGIAIAAAKGFRYVWFVQSDHGGEYLTDGTETYVGFSNDPHIPPDPSTLLSVIPQESAHPGASGVFSGFNAWLVYNPDDATYPFYVYVEGGNQGGDGLTPGSFPNALNMVVYKTANFDAPFTPGGVSHPCTSGFGLTAYQRVYRLGTGNWISFGGGDPANNGGLLSKWTSTDGLTFTNGAVLKKQINSSGVLVTGAVSNGWRTNFNTMSERFQIGSDWYQVFKEDLRGPNWNSGTGYAINEQVNFGANTYKSLQNSNTNHSPASNPAWWQDLGVLGQYVTLVPVDVTTGDLNISGTPPMIRISNYYNGVYPTAGYLQYTTNMVEDGVLTIYALHGFLGDVGLVSGALPTEGGGLDEQYIDIYCYVIDAVAARASAPFGVRVSCAAGVVSLSWADVPAGRTYRVKRGTDGVTFGTTIGDVTGTSMTDTPTVGSVYYYQVTSLFGGTEQASRVVKTYVS